MRNFEYRKCTSLSEVTGLLGGEGVFLLAGGTDLLVGMRGGKYSPRQVLDIKGIPELKVLREDDAGIIIGAAVTLNQIERFEPVAKNVPVLAEACHRIGSFSIRNRGTLAGNICNASPAADTAAALYCLGALVNIAGPGGERSIAIEDFFVAPGKTALNKGELVVSVLIPKPYPAGKGIYYKASRTGSVDLATVGVAVQKWDDGVRIAVSAAAPTPVRAKAVEKAVSGGVTDWNAAAALVKDDIIPITDLRGSREYRCHLAEVLVRRGLAEIMEV